jgi:hypothetical protein
MARCHKDEARGVTRLLSEEEKPMVRQFGLKPKSEDEKRTAAEIHRDHSIPLQAGAVSLIAGQRRHRRTIRRSLL